MGQSVATTLKGEYKKDQTTDGVETQIQQPLWTVKTQVVLYLFFYFLILLPLSTVIKL